MRTQIKELRAKGMTYSEICQVIGREIPKATLSYICKDVVLPPEYARRHALIVQENAQRARIKAAKTNALKLQARFERINQQAFVVVSTDSIENYEKICLATLYIAEGSKYKSYRGLALGSSDPDILRLYMSLLMRCYGKKMDNFRARIQHRSDQDSNLLKQYWSKQLNLPETSFYLSYADKRTLGKPTTNVEYKGVCVISCSGADIQLELDAIARLYGQKLWGISSVG